MEDHSYRSVIVAHCSNHPEAKIAKNLRMSTNPGTYSELGKAMRSMLCAALLFVMLLYASCRRQSPGVQDTTLEAARTAINARAEEIGTAVLLILKDGQEVFRFGDVTRKYMCHSIRKPFIGSLYGIYRDRGIINLNLTLEDLGIDDIAPSLTSEEKRATIRHLLLSRSGVYHEAGGEAQSRIELRPPRGSHKPGTFFYYNNWDFNALGTIFEHLTGQSVFQAFYREIAQPIGMQDFSPTDGTYVFESEKSIHPSYFFRLSSRDMARFGLLYANGGYWDGREVVPRTWIEESTAVYPLENLCGDPYGYLWRIIPPEAGLGYGYYHTGLGVHLLAVLPDHNLVVVHRVDTDRPFRTTWPEIKDLLDLAVDKLNLLEQQGVR